MRGARRESIPLGRNDIALSDDLRARLSAFLRRRYPRDTAKRVARDVGCDPETSQKWACGSAFPTRPAHLAALTLAYGQDWLDAVFAPLCEQSESLERHALIDEERALLARQREINTRLHGASGAAAHRSSCDPLGGRRRAGAPARSGRDSSICASFA